MIEGLDDGEGHKDSSGLTKTEPGNGELNRTDRVAARAVVHRIGQLQQVRR